MGKNFKRLALALAAGAAIPAAAQMRKLDVPAKNGWQHAQTKLILRSTLAGLHRTDISDNGTQELDVSAQFEDATGDTFATVFLFRPAMQSVPVWFDRSETQILLRDLYGSPVPVAPPLAFAAPKAKAASSLRRAYVPGKTLKGSVLALVPMGDWLVALRLSSKTLANDQLDPKMSELIAAIGWPDGVKESPVAVPVAACPAPLPYAKKAKLRKPDMSDAILGSALLSVVADKEKEVDAKGDTQPAATFCRDLPGKSEYGVYRTLDSTNSYTMALGDAGRTVSIFPSFSAALAGGKPGFSFTVGLLDSSDVYPDFDKLPPPDQVWETLGKVRPISSSSHDSKNITISMPSK